MRILLIGCGKMGGAMLDGWIRSDAVVHVDIISPHATSRPPQDKVTAFDHVEDWSASSSQVDIAVLAVKPQKFPEVCMEIRRHLPADLPILSVAAGITLASMASLLGDAHPIIRAMPNTPGAIGKGITAYCLNNKTDNYHIDIAVSLLSVSGKVLQVSDEEAINAVTAISGCGPAYFYLFTEAIEKAAINIGLTSGDAGLLARQTFTGAAALLDHSGQTPGQLRAMVTSPGGATEAALQAFQANQGLESQVESAIRAALDRARTLGKTQ